MKNKWGLTMTLACLAGCGVVTTDSPIVSETSADLQEKLRGVWRGADAVVHVEFDAAGRGVFASLEWDGERFTPRTGELFAVDRDDWHFISARSLDGEDKKEGYVLGAFRRLDSGEMVVWPASSEAFRSLVEEGKIEGEIFTKYATSVRVSDGPKLLDWIGAPRDFFQLEEPILFHPLFPGGETTGREVEPGGPGDAHSQP